MVQRPPTEGRPLQPVTHKFQPSAMLGKNVDKASLKYTMQEALTRVAYRSY